VGTYLDDIKIPTLLAQGEADTLFNLNEAVATYQALKARHVPVKLMFQSWGHSGLGPAPGELDLGHPEGTYQGEVFAAWFDRHLKDLATDTGEEFEFFRPWVPYTGSAEPAYGSAPRYPLKDTLPLRLSGTDALAGPGSVVAPGSATFAAPPGGEPASYSETSFAQDQEPFASIPPTDPPGTFGAFSTPALTGDVDVVGLPTLDVTLSTPASTYADPGLAPTLYAKLYDVAPDGSVTLVHRLVSPVRLGTANQKVRIHLPGIVHRFPSGHRVRLVLATTDQAYLSSRGAHVVTVTNDPAAPHVLTLPVTSKKASAAVPRVLGERTVSAPTGPAPAAPGGTTGSRGLASTGTSDALAPLAMVALLVALRHRRRHAEA
jgi:ABC-2 type transport system ATP-binding protein